MPDDKYCYPNSNVLKNKLNITDKHVLFEAEKDFAFARLKELQEKPITGKYDFKHLKAIHKYIFQDIYEWAGKERTVEIGKGNLFCMTAHIQNYANDVFSKYFPQCYATKDNFDKFIKTFADNYGDLNALHPFREGNGRAQREFARVVCLKCGYDFNLSHTTHKEMLNASKLSFDKGDNSAFIEIFHKAVTPCEKEHTKTNTHLSILTADDLIIGTRAYYKYYGHKNAAGAYKEKITNGVKDAFEQKQTEIKPQSDAHEQIYTDYNFS